MNTWELMTELIGFRMGFHPLTEGTKAELSSEKIKNVMALAKNHDIAPLIADVIVKECSDFEKSDPKLFSALRHELALAVFRYERSEHELASVTKAFCDAKLYHVPLKGSVIRKMYPEPWLRTSCDIDILVKWEDFDKAGRVLTDILSYRAEGRTAHDASFYSPSGVHIELHFSLIEEGREANASEVLKDVWDDAKSNEEGVYTCSLSDEMFYFYHIAHMAKHFEVGGCGVRPFIDLLILSRGADEDRLQKRRNLLECGVLAKFEKSALDLAKMWFCGAKPSDLTLKMSEFILGGGVYGSVENYAVTSQVKKGGKIRYIMSRLFLPYSKLKYIFPVLQKHKWLFPFYQFVRWFKVIFGGRLKKAVKEVSVTASTSREESRETEKFLNDIGL